MKLVTLAASLVVGLVFLAQGAPAATLQSYARVNLVQGTEVMALKTAQEPGALLAAPALVQAETLAKPVVEDRLQFVLAGPADQQVSLQMAPLDPGAQWWDEVSGPGTRWYSTYDADGFLWLDYQPEVMAANQSSRLILSVIYE